ncbi:MAG: NPCBM/NEW2 domain-containing protein [Thermoanaerobaculia bacterium]|nr:NPCBM/NEW2 domain-containing protein [Thermoanaerobaculia bacterium]
MTKAVVQSMKTITDIGPPVAFLDDLIPTAVAVGYGELGSDGFLGYEGKRVRVGGRSYEHALSTHPPASLSFDLDGRSHSFHCCVALNDDVPRGRSHADFSVWLDGRRAAFSPRVTAGEPPRDIAVDVTGARRLELKVETSRWPYSHAVWLDPRLGHEPVQETSRTLVDCLQRVEMTLPPQVPRAERCIATVVSPGFERLVDDLLGSLHAYGGCADALRVLFVIGDCAGLDDLVAKHRCLPIHCRAISRVNPTVKSVMYSLPLVVEAEHFLALDGDMLVLGDLGPIFGTLEACPPGTLLACQEGNGPVWKDLNHALCTVYGGRTSDIGRLLGSVNGEARYPLVVNDGLLAGDREGLLMLDAQIRDMPQAPAWTDERRDIWWRNQFVFNLALARLGCGVELDPIFNLQLNSQDVEMRRYRGRVQALWQGREARVLHFNGLGRDKYPEFRQLFGTVDDPLSAPGAGDSFGEFLRALRAWVGERGVSSLAWSVYGRSDARDAAVADPSTFPLLALLHYLLRSSGCRRVLETGTARGVSAACLASAVAHRDGARVVTFDIEEQEDRQTLWDLLPEEQRAVIEARTQDSVLGLTAAVEAGERYDAAFLDSQHTLEHVLAEFELATQLVSPGGLILIHDVLLEGATVGEAVDRIQDEGYGVARLWTAEAAAAEGDRLGLAVVENRPTSRRDSE